MFSEFSNKIILLNKLRGSFCPKIKKSPAMENAIVLETIHNLHCDFFISLKRKIILIRIYAKIAVFEKETNMRSEEIKIIKFFNTGFLFKLLPKTKEYTNKKNPAIEFG